MRATTANERRFRSIVFDFDYTLADSSGAVIECVNYAMGKMGLPASDDTTIRSAIGISLFDSYRLFSGDDDGKRFAEFRGYFVERGDQVMADGTHMFDSVRPAAEALVAEGFSLGIVSTKFRRRIECILEREALIHLFPVIVGGEDVSRHKPDPSGLETALAMLGIGPRETLYVGDSVVDAETAKAANVPFAAVLSGVTALDALAAYDPVAILEDLRSLPAVVL